MFRNLCFALPVIGNRLRSGLNISGVVKSVSTKSLIGRPLLGNAGHKSDLDLRSKLEKRKISVEMNFARQYSTAEIKFSKDLLKSFELRMPRQ